MVFVNTLKRTRGLWATLAIIVIACLLGDWLGCARGEARWQRLPYSGLLLEWLGVLAAAYGVATKIEIITGKGFFEHLLVSLGFRGVNLIVGSGNLKMEGMDVELQGKVTLPKDATFEDRIERLERMLDDAINGLSNLRKDFRKENKALEKKLLSEIDNVKNELQEVKRDSEDAHTRGAGLELAAVVWILFGLTLATVPELVNDYFGWLPQMLGIWECSA